MTTRHVREFHATAEGSPLAFSRLVAEQTRKDICAALCRRCATDGEPALLPDGRRRHASGPCVAEDVWGVGLAIVTDHAGSGSGENY